MFVLSVFAYLQLWIRDICYNPDGEKKTKEMLMQQETVSDEASEVALSAISVLIRYGASMQACLPSSACGDFR